MSAENLQCVDVLYQQCVDVDVLNIRGALCSSSTYLGSVHSLISTQSLLTPSPTHSCPLQPDTVTKNADYIKMDGTAKSGKSVN